ncbi:glycerate kinase [Acuticoccus sediminis]|uniref:Glycerate kinase n=1 Tax=Acuticoccus sediminis TaxID=2184697 RepID=A0A8B2NNC0_9HYPH|nr:glycerate kinase [Acuticoccus sediminis]RAH97064.1 glycerate kinase [Acuticoccus sediminis]
MNILVACDKFRGSLTAREANATILEALASSALNANGTDVAIADGGEGTLDALAGASLALRTSPVKGPFNGTIDAPWGFDRAAGRAVIEMARAAGHAAATGGYDPDRATSAGIGDLIRAALDAGAREIIVAVGGSITVDGGAGALEALGARYFGADEEPVVLPAGRALRTVETVDLSGLDPRLAEARIILAADVDNPLVGQNGAARVFGPQKGVPVDDIDAFDLALAHFDRHLATARGSGVLADTPFAGAAGGMMVGLSAAAPTSAVDGFSLIFEHHRLNERIDAADLVVTGEGSLDGQSLSGKGPVAVARAASAMGKPVLAFAGRIAVSPDELAAQGITAAFAIGRGPATLEEALKHARASLAATARAAFDSVAAGQRLA